MKFSRKIMVGALFMASTLSLYSQSLGDILGGLGGNSNIGDIVSSVVEGVFTKTDLSLADLVGEYKTEGPAVTFKSENLLQKAGGIAGAATIESKLKPYYEKYGLNNMTLTVDQDANFTMKVKGISFKGTITKNDSDGTFNFNFNVMGMQIGKFVTYIEKSGSTLKLMFDASKLKDIISMVAKFTGNSMASALGTILESYDGACIGFRMISVSNSSESSTTDTSNSSGSAISSGLDALKGILNKGN